MSYPVKFERTVRKNVYADLYGVISYSRAVDGISVFKNRDDAVAFAEWLSGSPKHSMTLIVKLDDAFVTETVRGEVNGAQFTEISAYPPVSDGTRDHAPSFVFPKRTGEGWTEVWGGEHAKPLA